MNKIKVLVKINKHKYYSNKVVKNTKYNKYLNRFKINIIKNLDQRNEIKLGSVILFNNYINKNKFVKYLNKI